jgi:uncharacterized tellurite resistance protein B-like protein
MKTTPHIELLIQLSRIDGEASKVELDLIREIGASEHFSDEDFENALAKMDDQPTLTSLEDLTEDEKITMVIHLIQVIKADGKVEPSEISFCHDVVEKLGFPKEKFVGLVLDILDKEVLDPDMNIEFAVRARLLS